MRQFILIWFFYRSFAVSSLTITAIAGFINPSIGMILIVKAFLTVFLWYLVNETHYKRKLIGYNSLGVSTFKLFIMMYILDSLITSFYLLLFKNFT